MYERIFDISKMIAKIDIMIFCNIAPHSKLARLLSSYADRRPKLARLLNDYARKPLGKPKLDPKSGYFHSSP